MDVDFVPILAKEIIDLMHGDVPRLTSTHLKSLVGNRRNIITWNIPDIEFSKKSIEISIDLKPKDSSTDFSLNIPNSKLHQHNLGALASFIQDKIAIDYANN